MNLRIFGDKPFARDQWGPRYPLTMPILLSVLMIIAGLKLGREILHGPSLQGMRALALLPFWWYAYFRLHRGFAEAPRRTVALIIALMTVGVFILLFSIG